MSDYFSSFNVNNTEDDQWFLYVRPFGDVCIYLLKIIHLLIYIVNRLAYPVSYWMENESAQVSTKSSKTCYHKCGCHLKTAKLTFILTSILSSLVSISKCD